MAAVVAALVVAIAVIVLLVLHCFGRFVALVALPVARGAVVPLVAPVPAVGFPAIAFALHDRPTANPDVVVVAPAPVARRPDVARLHGRHDFILRRGRSE